MFFWTNHRWRAVASAVAAFALVFAIVDIPAVAHAIGGAPAGSDLFTPDLGQAFVQSLMVSTHGSALQTGISQGGRIGQVGDYGWLLVLTVCVFAGLVLLSRVLPPTRRNWGVSLLACWGTVMLAGLVSGLVDAVLGLAWLQDGTGFVGQFVLLNLGEAVTTGGPAVVLLGLLAAAVYAGLGARPDPQDPQAGRTAATGPSAALEQSESAGPARPGRPGRVALLVTGLFTGWHLLISSNWTSMHLLWPDGTSLSGFPAVLRDWLLFDTWTAPDSNLPWYAWLAIVLQLGFPSLLLWLLLRKALPRLADPGGIGEGRAFAVTLVLVPLAVMSTALPDPVVFWLYATGYPGGVPRLLAVLYQALGAGAVVLPLGLLLGWAAALGARRWCGPDAVQARQRPPVQWRAVGRRAVGRRGGRRRSGRGRGLPAAGRSARTVLTDATTSAVRGVRGRRWPESWRRGRTDGSDRDEASP